MLTPISTLCIQFVKDYERLYFRARETRLPLMKSNLHALCHLADMLRDCGPGYVWWCFGAERFNGMIEGKAKSKVHLNTSLGNTLWMEDVMIHAQFSRNVLSAEELNRDLRPYGVAPPAQGNLKPYGHFLSSCGANDIELPAQHRMTLCDYMCEVFGRDYMPVNIIPPRTNR